MDNRGLGIRTFAMQCVDSGVAGSNRKFSILRYCPLNLTFTACFNSKRHCGGHLTRVSFRLARWAIATIATIQCLCLNLTRALRADVTSFSSSTYILLLSLKPQVGPSIPASGFYPRLGLFASALFVLTLRRAKASFGSGAQLRQLYT